jgi:large subunit ribosomal protein L21
MYAVIRAGGKQQKVKPGDVIEVELTRSEEHTESVTFAPLLVVDDDGKTHVGKDLGKATVTAKLIGEKKGEKVHIFKYRPKSGYARRQGHRQRYTLVEIEDISVGGARASNSAVPTMSEESRPVPSEEVEGAADVASATAGGAPVEEITPAAGSEPEPDAVASPADAGGGDAEDATGSSDDQAGGGEPSPRTAQEEEGL